MFVKYKTLFSVIGTLLLSLSSVIAQNTSSSTISKSDMRAIFDEVKTPYKYGVVMRAPRSGDMVDCPTVFREKNADGTFGKWKMTYVLFDGRGYETWLAESDDLLHWTPMERVLKFPADPKKGKPEPWDYHQRGGFPALQDMTWGGDYTIGTYKGKHWMTYIGSKKRGYEGVPISIGLASTKGDITQPHEWKCMPEPILNYGDKDTLWWESYSPYKSCIYYTPEPLAGNPYPLNTKFFMYYNSSYQGNEHNKGERIGIATSNDMLHWKRYEGNPVFQHDFMSCITGDAHIQRVPFTNEKGQKDSLWVMFYFCAYNPEWKQYPAYNSFACSRDLLHWTDWTDEPLVVPSEYYDINYSHKSCVIKHNGVVYHYYCAVDKDYRRTIALSTSKDFTAEGKVALLPEDAAKTPLAKYNAETKTDTDFENAAWIAYESDDTIIVPAVHQPFVKRTFGDKKPGLYRLPLFKKDITLNTTALGMVATVKDAELIVCGLGHFEATINGEKVGNHFLDPAWSQYRKEAYYVKFDVTSQVAASAKGLCTLKIALGNGFYNVPREGYAKLIQSYGAPKVKALLRINYADGTTQLIPTDDTWQVQQSPVYYSSIYSGESYDARLEANKKWQKPLVAKQSMKLIEQQQAVTYHGEFAPKSVKQLNDSTVVYDFGQNCASIPRITVKGKKGDHITMKPAELVYEDGRVHNTVAPKYHFDYIVGDNKEHTWQPQFSYTGSRYIEVTKPATTTLDIKLIPVYADMQEVGSFHSSDTILNSIHSLIDWAIRSNTQSVSTDCPTREKLGWLEQAYLMQESMMYRYDMTKMFPKMMDDMATAQHRDGCIPTIAPEYVDFGGDFSDTPEWGSAFIEVPWKYYQWYGDDSLIRKHYDNMARYIDYLTSRADTAGIVRYGLGDWYDLGPNAPGYAQLTSRGVTTTATYYHEVKLMQKMSMMLGMRSELQKWSKLSKKIKADYNKAFLKVSNCEEDSVKAYYDRNSQAANAISLCMGLVPDTLKESVRKALADDIIAKGNTAGDIGYRYVLQALTESGRDDLIYRIATTTEQPSYAYQLKKGVTALAESWQALERVSNNHLMLGHLMQWLYGIVGGISQANDSNGWNHIIINPVNPNGEGKPYSCSTSLNTTKGVIRCNYTVTANGFNYDVTVPEGCRATVMLPTGPVEQTAGRKLYKK